MADYVCLGDLVCLYCEATQGYVNSWQTSDSFSEVYTFNNQDRQKPTLISDPHMVVYEICIQNRYKLNKAYRRLLEAVARDPDNSDLQAELATAKLCAEAETGDNVSEQQAETGTRLCYGDVIQLRQVFSGKYIHISADQTSANDKNNLKVYLNQFNAKNAHLKVVSNYRVKEEGQEVQYHDEVVFESVKSSGQFLHASSPYQIDQFHFGSELNLGVDASGFSLTKYFRPTPEKKELLRGGMVIQLYHKVLEANLVAEGLFDHELVEDVHLAVRKPNPLKPHTLDPPTSGITFWQIIDESSIIKGDTLRWEQTVQFRHMTTGLYLCVNRDREVCLRSNSADPDTVFRMHNLLKDSLITDEIKFNSFARIEHVITECWLHGDIKTPYNRQHQTTDMDDRSSPVGPVHTNVPYIKLTATKVAQFSDAFTIYPITEQLNQMFNYVAGSVPTLLNLLHFISIDQPISISFSDRTCQALKELKEYMYVLSIPLKGRQKLLRNLRVIDLLIKVLNCPVQRRDAKEGWITIFSAIFEIFQAYLMGNSRKNKQYFMQYVDFCQSKFLTEESLGLKVADILVELIRGNRAILNRITQDQISSFIAQFRRTRNYCYLALLNVTSTCDDVAITDNQLFIADNLLKTSANGLYLTCTGDKIGKDANVIFISENQRKNDWIELFKFVDKSHPGYHAEKVNFFMHQLDFFYSLTFGRNRTVVDHIKELGLFTWHEVFTGLQCDQLPQRMRAKYCDLLIALFVEVGMQLTVLEKDSMCFVYDQISIHLPSSSIMSGLYENTRQLLTISTDCEIARNFSKVKTWMRTFLADNTELIASQVGQNVLIDRVLKLLHRLINYGYYGSSPEALNDLNLALMNILDSKSDLPVPMLADVRSEARNLFKKFKKTKYEKSVETTAVVNAKIGALEVIDLILTFQFNKQLQSLLSTFKIVERSSMLPEKNHKSSKKKKREHVLQPVLSDSFLPLDRTSKKSFKQQRYMIDAVKAMLEQSSIIDTNQFTRIILGLTRYKYDNIVMKALDVVDKFFSIRLNVFKMAIRSQMLLTSESCKLNDELLAVVPALRKLTKSKLTEDQAESVCQIVDKLTGYCRLPEDPTIPHVVNQNIIISHNLLMILFDLLHSGRNAAKASSELSKVYVKIIHLLRALACENDCVKQRIFDCFSSVLRVHGLENDIALLLKDAFAGNLSICLRVQPEHVDEIIKILCELSCGVPEFLELLCAIVKVSELDIPLRRNQSFVMKSFMRSFSSVASYFNEAKDHRMAVLRGENGKDHQQYLSNLVMLLALCAEGENRLTHSLCKTILTVSEITEVLVSPQIVNNVKKSYLMYLQTVYLGSVFQTADVGTAELAHDKLMWRFMQKLFADIVTTTKFIRDNIHLIAHFIKTPVQMGKPVEKTNIHEMVHANLHFILDAVLPFLSTFVTRFYTSDPEKYPNESGIINNLANACLYFGDTVRPHLVNSRHMNSLLTTVVITLASSNLPRQTLDKFIDDFKDTDWISSYNSEARQSYFALYEEELEVNQLFRRFVLNTSLLYGGYNTVAAQLQISSRWAANTEYTEVTGREALPLGAYFQDHVRAFIRPHKRTLADQYAMFGSIINQLKNSSGPKPKDEAARINQERLNIKCLQLIRAAIHNEMVKLPEDWKDHYDDHKQTLKRIGNLQNCLINLRIIEGVMPWMGSTNDEIVRETLSVILCLLFNANRTAQTKSLEYFMSTRQESFFTSIKNCMSVSISAYKESRVMNNWNLARVNEIEILAKRKKLNMVLRNVREATKTVRQYERYVTEVKTKVTVIFPSSSFEELQKAIFKRLKSPDTSFLAIQKLQQGLNFLLPSINKIVGTEKKTVRDGEEKKSLTQSESIEPLVVVDDANGLSMEDGMEMMIIQSESSREPSENFASFSATGGDSDQADDDMVPQAGDADNPDEKKKSLTAGPGNLGLVMQIIAQMCDGQNRSLQDYLREQSDNIRSVNLVTETVNVLSTLYSNINAETIGIVTQIFDTLNEMTSGNQATRTEVVNCKIIDYVNVILRSGHYTDCEEEEIVQLKLAMAKLVKSLIEENGIEEKKTAIEVKDTLDHEAVCKLIASCYEAHKVRKPRLSDLKQTRQECSLRNTGRVIKSFANSTVNYIKFKVNVKHQTDFQESVEELGFASFLIMRRFFDLDKDLERTYLDPTVKSLIQVTPKQRKAFRYYQSCIQSVEIIKDDCIQKVNFRIKNKSILREEVKENLKWNVDRSSTSEKHRDFYLWFKDLAVDLRYQKKVLSNLLMTVITRYWIVWSYICMFLSLVINLFMLITWRAQLSMTDLVDWQDNQELPPELYNTSAWVPDAFFNSVFIYTAGAIHNLFALLVLIGYFMANNPQISSIQQLLRNVKTFFTGSQSSVSTVQSNASAPPVLTSSRVAVQVLSIKTLYYLVFLAFSLWGTFSGGYFFAFHLLNIMSTNALLGGVIKSVTQNAQSLIWVAILGVVVTYIFSLAGFAFLRDIFEPDEHMFCATLTQCFVTYLRHGWLGTYDDKFYRNKNAPGEPFTNFTLNTFAQLAFFIIVTTIGLNIIFGIIVDTFSELRNRKWTAEADMRDCCFICGINSYVFESHSNGFRRHIKNEHNMWSYMYFMLHLSETDPNDFSCLELHVYKLMIAEQLDFFPMSRAMSLAKDVEDETDTKLDELNEKVDLLVQKMKEQETQRRREQTRLLQRRWQETHQRPAKFSGSVDSERPQSMDEFGFDRSVVDDFTR